MRERSWCAASRAPSSRATSAVSLIAVSLRFGISLVHARALHARAVASLAAGVFARDPVRLLDLADQLFALSVDLAQGVVRVPTPLLLEPACHLLPVTLQSIPIHRRMLREVPIPRRAALDALQPP